MYTNTREYTSLFENNLIVIKRMILITKSSTVAYLNDLF